MSTNINIGDLVRKVANSSADDLPTLFELQGKLHEVKETIPTVNHPELGFMLDAASDLMRYLADGQQPSSQAMLTMLTRLLVNAECSMYRNLEVLAGGAIAMREAHPSLAMGAEESASGPQKLQLEAQGTVQADASDLSCMRLGQFLVQLGLVSAQQVAEAMEVQQREKVRLGEALAMLGHVMPEDLKDALSLRTKMHSYASKQDEGESDITQPQIEMNEWQGSLLGTVLVSNKVISQKQLDEGLAIQKATGMRLGEALVQHGFCEWPQVRSAIQTQERLRHVGKPMGSRTLSMQAPQAAPPAPRMTPPSRIPPPPV